MINTYRYNDSMNNYGGTQMKKYIKIISVIVLLLILVSTCIETFALEVQVSNSSNQVVTKEKLEESLKGYADGSKSANAKVGSSSYSIGTDGSEQTEIVVTDTTVEFAGYVYNYTISNSKVHFTYDVEVKDGDTDYVSKMLQTMLFPTLFVAVTDLYGIDSNKSLYYYESVYNANRAIMESVPSDVDVNDAISYMKYLSTTSQFKEINNPVFTVNYNITENSDTVFKCTDNLVINLDKVNSIVDFNATAYEMSNTNTEEPVVTGVENKVNNVSKNTNTNTALPYSGLEDDNTFISVSLILIGIALIFYVKYITLKIKEN